MLKIYNSQTRQKEEFVPLDQESGRVGMYYCGPTVYDGLHLGHARAAIVPDMVRRYIEHKGYVVRYVTNFTDVDDKIIKRAIKENRDWREITVTYMEEYHRLMAAVGNRPVDVHPRATDHVPEMLELVQRLLDADKAYVASNGDVYFDTHAFEKYLALSNRSLQDQETGRSGRLSDSELSMKKNPADFILWKLLINDPEEFRAHPEHVPGWDSPWGRGRPGWHLECSALSRHYLGMPFDIHGGGLDLLFPHHENEKAQNDCAFCDELSGGDSVRYWIHNGFITVKAESEDEQADEHTVDGQSKMSKSLGNVKWMKEMIWPDGPFDPMAIRMLMLQSHYRSPLQFSADLLSQSMARVERIYSAVDRLMDGLPEEPAADEGQAIDADVEAESKATKAFEAGMDDDFNTPRALAAIDELIQYAKSLSGGPAASRRHTAWAIIRLSQLLGIRAVRPKTTPGDGSDAEKDLLHLLGELRQEARASKNWGQADKIRDRLAELGFEIRDGQAGAFEVVQK